MAVVEERLRESSGRNPSWADSLGDIGSLTVSRAGWLGSRWDTGRKSPRMGQGPRHPVGTSALPTQAQPSPPAR